ncbi:MAG: hypothetical protein LBT59_02580 [Clostridiales bacterium]|jgi:hypothetical protein|nr:hypothetical protein [Clostridiales bacterium]
MSKKVLSIIPAALFIFLIFVFTVVSAIFVLQGINFYHYLPIKMFAIAIFLTAIVSLLSFLKLRYWFPSLPLYIFFSTYISVQNLYLSNFIKSYLLILFFTALFQGSVYLVSIAVDIILAFDSDFDKFKLGAILDSCFGDLEKKKFLCSLKGFLVAILFQIALFICTHFIYELVPSFSLLFVLLLGLSIAAIVNKIKIRNWILSMSFYFVLSESLYSFGIGKWFFRNSVYRSLVVAEFSIIFAFFVLRFLINYRKAKLARDRGVYVEPVELSREN